VREKGRTVVHILTRWLRAGSEENTFHSCRAQAAAGDRVVVIHGNESDTAFLARVSEVAEVYRADRLVHHLNPKSDILAIFQLCRMLRELRADVVHTHQSKAGILGRVAARLAGVPTIVHGVHILPWEHVSRAQGFTYLAAEWLCAPFTDAFISVSPSVRDACIDRGVGRPEKHFVAYSAMDVDRFRRPDLPSDAASLLGLEPGQARPPVAVMLAAFEPRKRHAEVVRALPEAFKGLADWRVVFAGQGAEEPRVRALVHELGLDDKVRFAGYRSDPERIIALADVAFLTSEREGLPRVVVQYAAAGKPMVLSAVPGLSDVLGGPESAVLIDVGDVPAAVREIGSLLRRPERRKALSAAAGRIPVDRWSPAAMARSVENAYIAAGAAPATPLRIPTLSRSSLASAAKADA
jgi:glycosyltransferase involved in cell wall biosynthesis